MKIVLVNNTSSEFPLTGGVPNLGPYARQTLELSTHVFESLQSHLDSMNKKGLISYHVETAPPSELKSVEQHQEPVQTVKNALKLQTNMESGLSALQARYLEVESLFAEKIAVLEARVEMLQKQLSSSKPEALVFRVDSSNAVATSKASYEPLNGMSIKVPSSGLWVILFEVSVYSPVASKGSFILSRFGLKDSFIEGSERLWSRFQETPTSILGTISASLEAGDDIALYWRASEGALRATSRSITLLKI